MILQTGGTSDASRFIPQSHALQYRHTNPLSSLHLTPSRPGVAIFEDWTCRIFYKQQSSTKMHRVTNFYPRHSWMTGTFRIHGCNHHPPLPRTAPPSIRTLPNPSDPPSFQEAVSFPIILSETISAFASSKRCGERAAFCQRYIIQLSFQRHER